MKSSNYFGLMFSQLQFSDYQQTRYRGRSGCLISSFHHSPFPPSSDQRNTTAPLHHLRARHFGWWHSWRGRQTTGSVAARWCVVTAPPGSATPQRRVLQKERRRRGATESTAVSRRPSPPTVAKLWRRARQPRLQVEQTRLAPQRRLVLAAAVDTATATARWSFPTAGGRGRHCWIAARVGGRAGAQRHVDLRLSWWLAGEAGAGSLFRQSQWWRH